MKGKKTGGRTPGTRNFQSRDLFELLKKKYPLYHPVVAMADIAHKTKDEVLRLNANKEIAKYVCPQLKSVEMNLNNANDKPKVSMKLPNGQIIYL